MKITDREFLWIVDYMRRHYGIELGQKRVLIEGRLENYLLRNGFDSYSDFIRCIEQNPNGDEAKNIINILTTNHTFFMREAIHFEYLSKYVLPWIKQKEINRKDVRIWSAAASTGEEPYTLAMILRDAFAMDTGWDTQLLATDVSTKVLQKAKQGVYMAEQLEPLPDNWRRHYFKKIDNDRFQVTEELRRQVSFRQFNLMDEITFKGLFHVVFLRNVMIYFDEETKLRLIERIYNHMENGGYLFIGTTESIDKNKVKFRYVQPSVYRKVV